MRRLFVFCVVVGGLGPLGALACSCLQPQSVAQEVADSTRVFLGCVTAVEALTRPVERGQSHSAEDGPPSGATPGNVVPELPYKRVQFDVIESFKGDPVETLHVITGTGAGDCGYIFELGGEYVVYARGSEALLGTSICTLTGPASNPSSGLFELRSRSAQRSFGGEGDCGSQDEADH